MVTRDECTEFARAIVRGRNIAVLLRECREKGFRDDALVHQAEAELRVLADAVAALIARDSRP